MAQGPSKNERMTMCGGGFGAGLCIRKGTMEPIKIERNGEILACHTTEHPTSHEGRLVWIIADEDPEPGPALWIQGDVSFELEILGLVGGWLVCTRPEGPVWGIVWTDGEFYGDLIEDRETGSAAGDITLDDLRSGRYRVRGTVAVDGRNGDSPLGCVPG